MSPRIAATLAVALAVASCSGSDSPPNPNPARLWIAPLGSTMMELVDVEPEPF